MTNQLENLIGTCIDNVDTDGDGNSDYEELANGENPRTDIGFEVIPSSVLINVEEGEITQETISIQLPNLLDCTATIPILGIALQEDIMFSIIDTLGNFSECPYLVAEDGTFSLVIEFTSADTGNFFDTLIVTLVDTIIQVPLIADVTSSTETVDNSKSVRVFPNPSSGNITVHMEGWIGEITTQLIDIQGQVVNRTKYNDTNQGTIEIQINEIPKGNYLLELSNDKFHAIKKLIIQ